LLRVWCFCGTVLIIDLFLLVLDCILALIFLNFKIWRGLFGEVWLCGFALLAGSSWRRDSRWV
jgi:hypothetical protein